MKRPKNLAQYDVHVTNDYERKVAIDFYRKASKRGVHPCSSSKGNYVGMCNGQVCCGGTYFFGDNVVDFVGIANLADTPLRRQALDAAFRINSDSKPKVAKKKPVQSITTPVVTFSYPRHGNGLPSFRKVRVTALDDKYVKGYEITDNDPEGVFKQYNRAKVYGGSINLVALT